MSFDIVIPLAPKDIPRFEQSIQCTKRNVIGFRNIYIVTPNPSLINIPDCIPISEEIFPFKKQDISNMMNTNGVRVGWYFQQLIKLYAGFCIPGVLDKYLIIDSDIYFLKPTRFLNDSGVPLYCTAHENHIPYFDHMKRLHPSFHRVNPLMSGVTHHMMFDTAHVKKLFTMVESHHNNAESFWKLFMKCVDPIHYLRSGASEYEIYFNYMLLYHFTEIELRPLNWGNATSLEKTDDRDYIAMHVYVN